MIPEKKYEILDARPVYGPMYIPVTKSGKPFYSQGFAVRFFRTDGTDWVANFEPGWTGLKDVIELSSTAHLLVIANGTCYVMNPERTTPVSVFGVGYVEILRASNRRLVLQDQTDLTIIEPDGNHWDTERISWDGLKNLKIHDDRVTGLALDINSMNDSDEWVPFEYTINSKMLKGGSYPQHNAAKKPWWKVW